MIEHNELKMMQSYPLELKIAKAKVRIREFVERYGEENIYVSFSGGKDSTVLLDIVRQEYPNIVAVFCDTGLEHPEVREFVKTVDNVETIRPTKSFKEAIIEYGYPVISKEQAQYLYEIRTGNETVRNRRINGREKDGGFKLAKKWHFCMDAPFKISQKCCYVLKKAPFAKYERRTKRHPILGMLACESILRRTHYLKQGCNVFDSSRPRSMPLSIWTENDILEYIDTNNLPIASIYGDVIKDEDGNYCTTGTNRTGCIFCGFGAHKDQHPNRYQRLKKTHPKLYEYCIKGGEFEDEWFVPNKQGLGFGYVLDFMGVDY